MTTTSPWAPPSTDALHAEYLSPLEVSVDTARILLVDPGYLPNDAQARIGDLIDRGFAVLINTAADGVYHVTIDPSGGTICIEDVDGRAIFHSGTSADVDTWLTGSARDER
jgi:hypothetical protein